MACNSATSSEREDVVQTQDPAATADFEVYEQTFSGHELQKSSMQECLKKSEKYESVYAAKSRLFDFMQGDVYNVDSEDFAVLNASFPNADYKGIPVEPEKTAFDALPGTAGCSFKNKATESVELEEAVEYALTAFPYKVWDGKLYILPTFVNSAKIEKHVRMVMMSADDEMPTVLLTPGSEEGTWVSADEYLGWNGGSYGAKLDVSDYTEAELQQSFRISVTEENHASDVTDKVSIRVANMEVQSPEVSGYPVTGTRVTFAYEKSVSEPVEILYNVFSRTGEACNDFVYQETALLFANEGEFSIWYGSEITSIDDILYAARYADDKFIWACSSSEVKVPDVDIWGYYRGRYTSSGFDVDENTCDYEYECKFNEDFQGEVYLVAESGKGAYVANMRSVKVKAGDTAIIPYLCTSADIHCAEIDKIHLYFKPMSAEEYATDECMDYTVVNDVPMYYLNRSSMCGEVGGIVSNTDVADYFTSVSQLVDKDEHMCMCFIVEVDGKPYAAKTDASFMKLSDDTYRVYQLNDFNMPTENELYKRAMLVYD